MTKSGAKTIPLKHAFSAWLLVFAFLFSSLLHAAGDAPKTCPALIAAEQIALHLAEGNEGVDNLLSLPTDLLHRSVVALSQGDQLELMRVWPEAYLYFNQQLLKKLVAPTSDGVSDDTVSVPKIKDEWSDWLRAETLQSADFKGVRDFLNLPEITMQPELSPLTAEQNALRQKHWIDSSVSAIHWSSVFYHVEWLKRAGCGPESREAWLTNKSCLGMLRSLYGAMTEAWLLAPQQGLIPGAAIRVSGKYHADGWKVSFESGHLVIDSMIEIKPSIVRYHAKGMYQIHGFLQRLLQTNKVEVFGKEVPVDSIRIRTRHGNVTIAQLQRLLGDTHFKEPGIRIANGEAPAVSYDGRWPGFRDSFQEVFDPSFFEAVIPKDEVPFVASHLMHLPNKPVGIQTPGTNGLAENRRKFGRFISELLGDPEMEALVGQSIFLKEIQEHRELISRTVIPGTSLNIPEPKEEDLVALDPRLHERKFSEILEDAQHRDQGYSLLAEARHAEKKKFLEKVLLPYAGWRTILAAPGLYRTISLTENTLKIEAHGSMMPLVIRWEDGIENPQFDTHQSIYTLRVPKGFQWPDSTEVEDFFNAGLPNHDLHRFTSTEWIERQRAALGESRIYLKRGQKYILQMYRDELLTAPEDHHEVFVLGPTAYGKTLILIEALKETIRTVPEKPEKNIHFVVTGQKRLVEQISKELKRKRAHDLSDPVDFSHLSWESGATRKEFSSIRQLLDHAKTESVAGRSVVVTVNWSFLNSKVKDASPADIQELRSVLKSFFVDEAEQAGADSNFKTQMTLTNKVSGITKWGQEAIAVNLDVINKIYGGHVWRVYDEHITVTDPIEASLKQMEMGVKLGEIGSLVRSEDNHIVRHLTPEALTANTSLPTGVEPNQIYRPIKDLAAKASIYGALATELKEMLWEHNGIIRVETQQQARDIADFLQTFIDNEVRLDPTKEAKVIRPFFDGSPDHDLVYEGLSKTEGKGRVHWVVAVHQFDGGLDIPHLSGAVLITEKIDPEVFLEFVGRFLRLYPGKKPAEIRQISKFPSVPENLLEGLAKKQLRLEGKIDLSENLVQQVQATPPVETPATLVEAPIVEEQMGPLPLPAPNATPAVATEVPIFAAAPFSLGTLLKNAEKSPGAFILPSGSLPVEMHDQSWNGRHPDETRWLAWLLAESSTQKIEFVKLEASRRAKTPEEEALFWKAFTAYQQALMKRILANLTDRAFDGILAHNLLLPELTRFFLLPFPSVEKIAFIPRSSNADLDWDDLEIADALFQELDNPLVKPDRFDDSIPIEEDLMNGGWTLPELKRILGPLVLQPFTQKFDVQIPTDFPGALAKEIEASKKKAVFPWKRDDLVVKLSTLRKSWPASLPALSETDPAERVLNDAVIQLVDLTRYVLFEGYRASITISRDRPIYTSRVDVLTGHLRELYPAFRALLPEDFYFSQAWEFSPYLIDPKVKTLARYAIVRSAAMDILSGLRNRYIGMLGQLTEDAVGDVLSQIMTAGLSTEDLLAGIRKDRHEITQAVTQNPKKRTMKLEDAIAAIRRWSPHYPLDDVKDFADAARKIKEVEKVIKDFVEGDEPLPRTMGQTAVSLVEAMPLPEYFLDRSDEELAQLSPEEREQALRQWLKRLLWEISDEKLKLMEDRLKQLPVERHEAFIEAFNLIQRTTLAELRRGFKALLSADHFLVRALEPDLLHIGNRFNPNEGGAEGAQRIVSLRLQINLRAKLGSLYVRPKYQKARAYLPVAASSTINDDVETLLGFPTRDSIGGLSEFMSAKASRSGSMVASVFMLETMGLVLQQSQDLNYDVSLPEGIEQKLVAARSPLNVFASMMNWKTGDTRFQQDLKNAMVEMAQLDFQISRLNGFHSFTTDPNFKISAGFGKQFGQLLSETENDLMVMVSRFRALFPGDSVFAGLESFLREPAFPFPSSPVIGSSLGRHSKVSHTLEFLNLYLSELGIMPLMDIVPSNSVIRYALSEKQLPAVLESNPFIIQIRTPGAQVDIRRYLIDLKPDQVKELIESLTLMDSASDPVELRSQEILFGIYRFSMLVNSVHALGKSQATSQNKAYEGGDTLPLRWAEEMEEALALLEKLHPDNELTRIFEKNENSNERALESIRRKIESEIPGIASRNFSKGENGKDWKNVFKSDADLESEVWAQRWEEHYTEPVSNPIVEYLAELPPATQESLRSRLTADAEKLNEVRGQIPWEDQILQLKDLQVTAEEWSHLAPPNPVSYRAAAAQALTALSVAKAVTTKTHLSAAIDEASWAHSMVTSTMTRREKWIGFARALIQFVYFRPFDVPGMVLANYGELPNTPVAAKTMEAAVEFYNRSIDYFSRFASELDENSPLHVAIQEAKKRVSDFKAGILGSAQVVDPFIHRMPVILASIQAEETLKITSSRDAIAATAIPADYPVSDLAVQLLDLSISDLRLNFKDNFLTWSFNPKVVETVNAAFPEFKLPPKPGGDYLQLYRVVADQVLRHRYLAARLSVLETRLDTEEERDVFVKEVEKVSLSTKRWVGALQLLLPSEDPYFKSLNDYVETISSLHLATSADLSRAVLVRLNELYVQSEMQTDPVLDFITAELEKDKSIHLELPERLFSAAREKFGLSSDAGPGVTEAAFDDFVKNYMDISKPLDLSGVLHTKTTVSWKAPEESSDQPEFAEKSSTDNSPAGLSLVNLINYVTDYGLPTNWQKSDADVEFEAKFKEGLRPLVIEVEKHFGPSELTKFLNDYQSMKTSSKIAMAGVFRAREAVLAAIPIIAWEKKGGGLMMAMSYESYGELAQGFIGKARLLRSDGLSLDAEEVRARLVSAPKDFKFGSAVSDQEKFEEIAEKAVHDANLAGLLLERWGVLSKQQEVSEGARLAGLEKINLTILKSVQLFEALLPEDSFFSNLRKYIESASIPQNALLYAGVLSARHSMLYLRLQELYPFLAVHGQIRFHFSLAKKLLETGRLPRFIQDLKADVRKFKEKVAEMNRYSKDVFLAKLDSDYVYIRDALDPDKEIPWVQRSAGTAYLDESKATLKFFEDFNTMSRIPAPEKAFRFEAFDRAQIFKYPEPRSEN